ncbi:MAG: MFS transporter, partial [Clostridiales bacterium]|nr:MFS transporter [Clostridiales bacterium]
SIRGAGLPVWLVSIIWMVYNASSISYLTFAGDYFVSIGYDVNYAAFLTSLFMVGGFVFSPIAGFLIDKLGGEEYFIAGGSVILTAILILIPRTNVNPLLLGSLIGIVSGFIPTPTFSLLPRHISPEKLGLGYGILATCLNVGILIGPLLVGFSYDVSKNYLSGFNIMAVFALAGAVTAIILRVIARKRMAE